MAQETDSFFLVPGTQLDEIRSTAKREGSGVSESSVELYESCMRENQLYLRARERATYHSDYTHGELERSVVRAVMMWLCERVWDSYRSTFTTEECAARLAALDAFEAHRGGPEGVCRIFGRRAPSVEPYKAVYADLRQTLARAVEEDAAFLWLTYDPTAEQRAEDARRKERELAERLARREREGPPRRTPEEQREDAEKLARVQADIDRLIDEGHERYLAEFDPDDPENEPDTWPELVVYPAPLLDQARAMDREADELWDSGSYDASLATSCKRKQFLWTRAHDEEEYGLQGQRRAFEWLWIELCDRCGLDPRPSGMHFTPDQTRALADALDGLAPSLGGRDATIERVLEEGRVHSRPMSEQAFDTLTRLLHTARDRHAALTILWRVEQ